MSWSFLHEFATTKLEFTSDGEYVRANYSQDDEFRCRSATSNMGVSIFFLRKSDTADVDPREFW